MVSCRHPPKMHRLRLPTGRPNSRVRNAKFWHLLEEARSVVQRTTRSTRLKNVMALWGSKSEDEQSGHTVAGVSIYDVHTGSEHIAVSSERALSIHLLTSIIVTADELSKPSASSKLPDENRRFAFEYELQKWMKHRAYSQVNARSLGASASVTASHVIFQTKFDLISKGQVAPWGHRDEVEDYLHDDASSVSLEFFGSYRSLRQCTKGWKHN